MDTTKGRKWLWPYLGARACRQGPRIVETTVYVVSGAIWPKRYPKGGGEKTGTRKRSKKEAPKGAQRPPEVPGGPQRLTPYTLTTGIGRSRHITAWCKSAPATLSLNPPPHRLESGMLCVCSTLENRMGNLGASAALNPKRC